MHFAAFRVTDADDVDVGAGTLEEVVAHHAAHGIGVDAEVVGFKAYGAVEIEPEVNHLVVSD